MSEKVDARGLSCPQPVLMALSKMKELGTGEIEILVDNDVSRETSAGRPQNKAGEYQKSHKKMRSIISF